MWQKKWRWAHLQDLRHALEAQAGVNAARRQRAQAAVRRLIALHEHLHSVKLVSGAAPEQPGAVWLHTQSLHASPSPGTTRPGRQARGRDTRSYRHNEASACPSHQVVELDETRVVPHAGALRRRVGSEVVVQLRARPAGACLK